MRTGQFRCRTKSRAIDADAHAALRIGMCLRMRWSNRSEPSGVQGVIAMPVLRFDLETTVGRSGTRHFDRGSVGTLPLHWGMRRAPIRPAPDGQAPCVDHQATRAPDIRVAAPAGTLLQRNIVGAGAAAVKQAPLRATPSGTRVAHPCSRGALPEASHCKGLTSPPRLPMLYRMALDGWPRTCCSSQSGRARNREDCANAAA